MDQIRNFFELPLAYSACNEDGRSEKKIMQAGEARRVLAISGGGERVFNLLTSSNVCEQLDIIDGNASQLYLFSLKKAAILNLSRPEYFKFVGISSVSGSTRIGIYKSLVRSCLNAEEANYWDKNLSIVEKGVIYQGRFEKFLKLIAFNCRLIFGGTFYEYFKCKSLAEQRKYFDEKIRGVRWEILMRILCRRIWFRLLSGDPAFYAYVDLESYYVFLRDKIEGAFLNVPASENFLLSLMLNGRYLPEFNVVPNCYLERQYGQVKRNLGSIEINQVHRLVDDYMQDVKDYYDFMSLSDIPSYLDTLGLKRTFNGISQALTQTGSVVR